MVHTLVGIGSLVSEASARNSFAFSNFRIGEVTGWRRCFNQANWVNVQHGWGSAADGDTGALAMIPTDPEFVSHVALMDVTDDELCGFYERETGYHIRATPFSRRAADGSLLESGSALMCTACADDAEADALWRPGGAMEAHCAGSDYAVDWMERSLRPLWPAPSATLLPSLGYMRLCAAAHKRAGLLEHFLDSTLLNDRATTLRVHIEQHESTRALIDGLTCALSDCSDDGEEAPPPSVHGDAVSLARRVASQPTSSPP